MNNFTKHRPHEDDLSQSSDEKMDTGSESFLSTQNTPNSNLSSDFEDRDQSLDQNNVLRLQNPETETETDSVLRLSNPEKNHNSAAISTSKLELNDSFVSKMSNLNLDSPAEENKIRPKNLGIGPPKLSSTLTLATNHPLMGLGSPDGNFPDLIPKKLQKSDVEKDLSLSSIEDERPTVESNGYDFFPQKNTSKNNLYFTENFVTADSQILDIDLKSPPDVARVTQPKVERRKIKPRTMETPQKDPSDSPWDFNQRHIDNKEGLSVNCLPQGNRDLGRLMCQSTPKSGPIISIDIPESELRHFGVADRCESPSQLRSMPNFELPIELTTDIMPHKSVESPDVISSSTQEDRSAYQALLNPYTGSVALTHKVGRSPSGQRRKIQLPPEEDRCSLDSMSACSLESEDEPPEPLPEVDDIPQAVTDDEDTKRSTNTISEGSEPIPEYSAADEMRDERSWLSVPRGNGHAVCDMKVIEPYKRVLSHGGYDGVGAAVIVFSACHLPDTARPDYHYVMDNLFLYVIWSLERLITDEYVLVYLHGSAGRRRLPNFHWLHECYKLIDRRLRKSLKHLYLVHPTFWLRSLVLLTKPFVSSKFFRKISYMRSLNELYENVPVEPNAIPEIVKHYDVNRR